MSIDRLTDIPADDIFLKSEINEVLSDKQQSDDKTAPRQASLTVKTLEPRILLSATWVDVEPEQQVEEPSRYCRHQDSGKSAASLGGYRKACRSTHEHQSLNA